MNNASMVDELQLARQLARWVAIGILPSQEKTQQACAAIARVKREHPELMYFGRSAVGAERVLAAANMGILPSQDNCREAEKQLDRAIEGLRMIRVQAVQERPTDHAN